MRFDSFGLLLMLANERSPWGFVANQNSWSESLNLLQENGYFSSGTKVRPLETESNT